MVAASKGPDVTRWRGETERDRRSERSQDSKQQTRREREFPLSRVNLAVGQAWEQTAVLHGRLPCSAHTKAMVTSTRLRPTGASVGSDQQTRAGEVEDNNKYIRKYRKQ